MFVWIDIHDFSGRRCFLHFQRPCRAERGALGEIPACALLSSSLICVSARVSDRSCRGPVLIQVFLAQLSRHFVLVRQIPLVAVRFSF